MCTWPRNFAPRLIPSLWVKLGPLVKLINRTCYCYCYCYCYWSWKSLPLHRAWNFSPTTKPIRKQKLSFRLQNITIFILTRGDYKVTEQFSRWSSVTCALRAKLPRVCSLVACCIVIKILDGYCPGKWIGHSGPIWPPRSPDLNPCSSRGTSWRLSVYA